MAEIFLLASILLSLLLFSLSSEWPVSFQTLPLVASLDLPIFFNFFFCFSFSSICESSFDVSPIHDLNESQWLAIIYIKKKGAEIFLLILATSICAQCLS